MTRPRRRARSRSLQGVSQSNLISNVTKHLNRAHAPRGPSDDRISQEGSDFRIVPLEMDDGLWRSLAIVTKFLQM